MIFDIIYYIPIGVLALNVFLIIKKTKRNYTKTLVAIANLWLILFIINNYFELWIYFFSIDSLVAREIVLSSLYEGFLLISIITLVYNIVVEFLMKFYKNTSMDYITLFSNSMSLIVVFFIHDLLKLIVNGNLENIALRILFISNLLFGTLFLVGNSILTTGLNLKKRSFTSERDKTRH